MPRIALTGTSINLSGITVDITPPTQELQDSVVVESNGGSVIPSGKLKVVITNMGFVLPGDTNSVITVNGSDLSPNPQAPVIFTAELDPVSNVFKTTEEITILNPNGSRVRVETTE